MPDEMLHTRTRLISQILKSKELEFKILGVSWVKLVSQTAPT